MIQIRDSRDFTRDFIADALSSFAEHYPKKVRDTATEFSGQYKWFLLWNGRYYSVKDVLRHATNVHNERNGTNIRVLSKGKFNGGVANSQGAGSILRNIGFRVVGCEEADTTYGSDLSDKDLNVLNELKGYIPDFKETTVSVRLRLLKQAKICLEHSNGICGGCDQEAPFRRVDGTPYLEAHHIDELGHGGIDHSSNMIALCPNCHREIHYGKNGSAINSAIRMRMA